MKFRKLEDRLEKLEPEPRHEWKISIPVDAFAESMRLIDQTIPPSLEGEPGPVIEWVGAMLRGDEKTAKELEKLPEIKRFQI